MSPLLKIFLELGPLATFFIAFNWLNGDGPDDDLDAIIWGNAALIVALAISLVVTYAMTRTIPRVALATGIVATVTGVLAIWLWDPVFVKMKPTIVNAGFAAILLIGLAQGRSYIRSLMESLIPLSDEGWMKLARNWAIYFSAMAVLNEVVWRTQPDETWVYVKTFVYPALAVVFTLSQAPLMARHSIEEPESRA